MSRLDLLAVGHTKNTVPVSRYLPNEDASLAFECCRPRVRHGDRHAESHHRRSSRRRHHTGACLGGHGAGEHVKLRRVIVKALHLNPDKRYSSAAAFRRALEQARPQVSWRMTPLANEWDGEGADGSSWRAGVAQRRGGYRFEVVRRLPGRGWRRLAADERNGGTEAELLAHAEEVMGRVAEHGR